MTNNIAAAADTVEADSFELAGDDKRVLLHCCCAPCAGPPIEKMHASGIEVTLFFYNPNIHPKKEYEIRKSENIRFAEKLGIKFVDADYDVQNWFARAKGMEYEPERGKRCTMCFDMRFERTALYAYENGYTNISSSLGISRWKDMDQINDSGIRAASHYDGVRYWTYNWRKKDVGDEVSGAKRMYDLAKEERFYKQEYCGCIYSLRDTNKWRTSKGRNEIAIGEEFYQKKLDDSNSILD